MAESTSKVLGQVLPVLRGQLEIDAAYLYGSRARGTARPDSDWDLGVVFSTYLDDPLERVLRPQDIEAVLERELHMYGQISVVDVELVPPPLQWNIIRGFRFYDRGVPKVRRLENAIISRIEKDYADA